MPLKNKKESFVLVSLLAIILTMKIISSVCSGVPHVCKAHNGDLAACSAAGCNPLFGGSLCTGGHDPCSTYTIQADCESHECTWTPEAPIIIEGGGGGIQQVIGIFQELLLEETALNMEHCISKYKFIMAENQAMHRR